MDLDDPCWIEFMPQTEEEQDQSSSSSEESKYSSKEEERESENKRQTKRKERIQRCFMGSNSEDLEKENVEFH